MKIKDIYKKKSVSDYALYSTVIVLGILLDRLTKVLAVEYLKPIRTLPLWQGVLHLTYVENPGAAFGILKDAPWVFNTVSVVATLAMLCYLYLGHSPNRLYAVSLSMIVSGGVGNLIDRFSLGYVVDFIDFTLIDFAVFNGADSFVCVGAGMLILALVLDIVKEAKENKKK